MDPLTIGLSIAGMGLQAFGAFGAAGKSKQIAQESQAIAGDEQKINEQRRLQMQLEAQRSQLQNMRNAQRLRAQATAAAVNQGATFGSGLYGGLAGITDQEGVNALGINQNLDIGQNIFSLNSDISEHKKVTAGLQGDMATDQSLMSLGGALVTGAKTISNIAGSFGGMSGSSGDYSGRPWSRNTGGLY